MKKNYKIAVKYGGHLLEVSFLADYKLIFKFLKLMKQTLSTVLLNTETFQGVMNTSQNSTMLLVITFRREMDTAKLEEESTIILKLSTDKSSAGARHLVDRAPLTAGCQ